MVTLVNNVEMNLNLILFCIILVFENCQIGLFLHAYGAKPLEIQVKVFAFVSTYIPTPKNNQNH